jgi:hypothetical protein
LGHCGYPGLGENKAKSCLTRTSRDINEWKSSSLALITGASANAEIVSLLPKAKFQKSSTVPISF